MTNIVEKSKIQEILSFLLVNSEIQGFQYTGIYTLIICPRREIYHFCEMLYLDILEGFEIKVAEIDKNKESEYQENDVVRMKEIFALNILNVDLFDDGSLKIYLSKRWEVTIFSKGKYYNHLHDLSWEVYTSDKSKIKDFSIVSTPEGDLYMNMTQELQSQIDVKKSETL